ncbi:MAG: hypothetical protein AVDCRST_MAG76-3416, partial [uncultured Acidimicrobiales bacterium]
CPRWIPTAANPCPTTRQVLRTSPAARASTRASSGAPTTRTRGAAAST